MQITYIKFKQLEPIFKKYFNNLSNNYYFSYLNKDRSLIEIHWEKAYKPTNISLEKEIRIKNLLEYSIYYYQDIHVKYSKLLEYMIENLTFFILSMNIDINIEIFEHFENYIEIYTFLNTSELYEASDPFLIFKKLTRKYKIDYLTKGINKHYLTIYDKTYKLGTNYLTYDKLLNYHVLSDISLIKYNKEI